MAEGVVEKVMEVMERKRNKPEGKGSTVEDEVETAILISTQVIPTLRRASKGKMASGQKMEKGITYG